MSFSSAEHKEDIFWRMSVTEQLMVPIDFNCIFVQTTDKK